MQHVSASGMHGILMVLIDALIFLSCSSVLDFLSASRSGHFSSTQVLYLFRRFQAQHRRFPTLFNIITHLHYKSRSKPNNSEQWRKYWKVVQEVHHRKIWDQDINARDIEVDLLHDSNSSDILLSSNLDDFTPTGLSRGEAIELEHTPAVEDDDTDGDMDDDTDDDIDNELESHVYIYDESD
ncbi:hypothetical protein QVD17_18834 [Tagetes erecta]|uniref:Uncharacterized protein n=1 Tax=Tagetes erecta TaxID=13708 RepID=A0AAD8KIF1_TARER|nr:hypothetical protein QVD17_18834 [Tagetes erecta]